MEGIDAGGGNGGAGGVSPLCGPPDATQLEFHQAMKDFQTMFPDMDLDVIEAVLRANNVNLNTFRARFYEVYQAYCDYFKSGSSHSRVHKKMPCE
ncbi:CUE domain-containing protein 1-like [Tropilaelaps mercedesae]|uniref:CUE domain-containing protein 1-like n=1 Tax=Tropilaelaps mercedesae TaxID=418985 RepID=A0A1V9WYI8_9ACAR|nr:CUE domain-containing protein 1-like [Tropilaelaps mercedesae]